MSKRVWIITLILTAIVIISWIIFEVVLVKPKVEIDPKLEEALQEVNPNFDQETIKQIENLYDPPIQTITSTDPPNLTPTPIPISSQNPGIATNSATQSSL